MHRPHVSAFLRGLCCSQNIPEHMQRFAGARPWGMALHLCLFTRTIVWSGWEGWEWGLDPCCWGAARFPATFLFLSCYVTLADMTICSAAQTPRSALWKPSQLGKSNKWSLRLDGFWNLSSAVAENCFSQAADNAYCQRNRLTSWVRAWVYTPSGWGGDPALLSRLGVRDISSIDSSIKGRWQQQQPYFKSKGRVLRLKIKCMVLILEERVQSMKTPEQRCALHTLLPIDHSGILQHPILGWG